MTSLNDRSATVPLVESEPSDGLLQSALQSLQKHPLPDVSVYPHVQWMDWLAPEIQQDYFKQLEKKLKEAQKHQKVFPPIRHRFAALKQDPFAVKVVILGQDPYHGEGQAHGLAFSVQKGVKWPPSLKNIFKEVEQEGFTKADDQTGNLERWANQGVLLLNTVLTVTESQPLSHRHWGWEKFTTRVIELLNRERSGLVFMLWGKEAQQKMSLINVKNHLVLAAPHPSPFSAHTGFFGCGHFKLANDYLIKQKQVPIQW